MNISIDVLGKLMPNILTLASQLAATLILFILMKKLAWEPVKKILDERARFEQEKLDEAERLRAENEELRRQMDEQLRQANIKAKETIISARSEGERLRDNLVEEGKARSQQLVADAEKNAELHRSKMLDEMKDDIVNVALKATEKMLSEKLDEEADRQVIDDFIKEVSGR